MKGKKSKRGRGTTKWAPVWIIPGGLALIAVAVALTFGASREPAARATPEITGAPRLKISPEKVDLGDVRLGRQVQVDIQLTNVGDQPLRLAKEPWIEVVEGC